MRGVSSARYSHSLSYTAIPSYICAVTSARTPVTTHSKSYGVPLTRDLSLITCATKALWRIHSTWAAGGGHCIAAAAGAFSAGRRRRRQRCAGRC